MFPSHFIIFEHPQTWTHCMQTLYFLYYICIIKFLLLFVIISFHFVIFKHPQTSIHSVQILHLLKFVFYNSSWRYSFYLVTFKHPQTSIHFIQILHLLHYYIYIIKFVFYNFSLWYFFHLLIFKHAQTSIHSIWILYFSYYYIYVKKIVFFVISHHFIFHLLQTLSNIDILPHKYHIYIIFYTYLIKISFNSSSLSRHDILSTSNTFKHPASREKIKFISLFHFSSLLLPA